MGLHCLVRYQIMVARRAILDPRVASPFTLDVSATTLTMSPGLTRAWIVRILGVGDGMNAGVLGFSIIHSMYTEMGRSLLPDQSWWWCRTQSLKLARQRGEWWRIQKVTKFDLSGFKLPAVVMSRKWTELIGSSGWDPACENAHHSLILLNVGNLGPADPEQHVMRCLALLRSHSKLFNEPVWKCTQGGVIGKIYILAPWTL